MFGLPFLISLVFTPLIIRFAFSIRCVDIPDGIRKLHARPTPKLGGIAIYFALLLSFLSYGLTDGIFLSISIGGGAALIGGIVDDLSNLSWQYKLALQIVAAFIGALFLGGTKSVTSILSFTVLSVLLMNAFNIIDGSDGLCASITLISSLTIAAATHNICAIMLFFAILGFLPYNIPARIFLGETGASFIGYTLSVIISAVVKEGGSSAILFAVALPIAELVTTFLRRVITLKNPFIADRGHTHHKLAELGFSETSVALIMMSIAGAVGIFLLI